jgi:hypothetical protein
VFTTGFSATAKSLKRSEALAFINLPLMLQWID